MRLAPPPAWAGANFFCRGVTKRSSPIFSINGGIQERRKLLLLLILQTSSYEKLWHMQGSLRSDWIENSSPQLGMFSSLQEASRWTGWLSTLTHWIISPWRPAPYSDFDSAPVARRCEKKSHAHLPASASRTRRDTRLFLPANNFRELAQSDIPNLRAYVRTREALRLRMPVEDPGVSQDLNTPEDYTRWKPKDESQPMISRHALRRRGRRQEQTNLRRGKLAATLFRSTPDQDARPATSSPEPPALPNRISRRYRPHPRTRRR